MREREIETDRVTAIKHLSIYVERLVKHNTKNMKHNVDDVNVNKVKTHKSQKFLVHTFYIHSQRDD